MAIFNSYVSLPKGSFWDPARPPIFWPWCVQGPQDGPRVGPQNLRNSGRCLAVFAHGFLGLHFGRLPGLPGTLVDHWHWHQKNPAIIWAYHEFLIEISGTDSQWWLGCWFEHVWNVFSIQKRGTMIWLQWYFSDWLHATRPRSNGSKDGLGLWFRSCRYGWLWVKPLMQ